MSIHGYGSSQTDSGVGSIGLRVALSQIVGMCGVALLGFLVIDVEDVCSGLEMFCCSHTLVCVCRGQYETAVLQKVQCLFMPFLSGERCAALGRFTWKSGSVMVLTEDQSVSLRVLLSLFTRCCILPMDEKGSQKNNLSVPCWKSRR